MMLLRQSKQGLCHQAAARRSWTHLQHKRNRRATIAPRRGRGALRPARAAPLQACPRVLRIAGDGGRACSCPCGPRRQPEPRADGAGSEVISSARALF